MTKIEGKSAIIISLYILSIICPNMPLELLMDRCKFLHNCNYIYNACTSQLSWATRGGYKDSVGGKKIFGAGRTKCDTSKGIPLD